jgi:putative ABC transport system permease protein
MTRLSPTDVARVGAAGLRTRPLRVFLSALGIAIGIGAMIAVVGVTTSSRADLDRQLARLGTNLLHAGPGQSLFGDASHLPTEAESMIRRIGPVTSVTATGLVRGARVYRNDRMPSGETGSIAVLAAPPPGTRPWFSDRRRPPGWGWVPPARRCGSAGSGSPWSASSSRYPWPRSWTRPR